MSNRFYTEQDGASWCIRDREIVYQIGMARGQPWRVEWYSSQEEAMQKAQELNETRGHASDEPKCSMCGAQPAGGDPVRCASCHSRMADSHG